MYQQTPNSILDIPLTPSQAARSKLYAPRPTRTSRPPSAATSPCSWLRAGRKTSPWQSERSSPRPNTSPSSGLPGTRQGHRPRPGPGSQGSPASLDRPPSRCGFHTEWWAWWSGRKVRPGVCVDCAVPCSGVFLGVFPCLPRGFRLVEGQLYGCM